MATGDDLVVISSRIASALGIRDGQTIEFQLVGVAGVSIKSPVRIRDGMQSDVLLHDLMTLLPMNRPSLRADNTGEYISLPSGKVLHIGMQNMWAGMRIQPPYTGTALLHVDGACRNNPYGPTSKLDMAFTFPKVQTIMVRS